MNKHISILASAILLAAVATPVSAADCNAPASFVDVKACNAARKGIDTLRQFAWRTRMIYAIYLPDYEKALPPEDVASAEAIGGQRGSTDETMARAETTGTSR